MPTYDYKCPKCDYRQEVSQKIHETSSQMWCIYCENQTTERQISKPLGIHFKGSGFYETDYKGKK